MKNWSMKDVLNNLYGRNIRKETTINNTSSINYYINSITVVKDEPVEQRMCNEDSTNHSSYKSQTRKYKDELEDFVYCY